MKLPNDSTSPLYEYEKKKGPTVMMPNMMVKGDELGWILGDWFGGLNTGRWGCDHIILLPSHLAIGPTRQ